MGRLLVDLTGKVFGKLTVISKDSKDNNGRYYWNCICECGNTKLVLGDNLNRGYTKSCGCTWRLKGNLHKNFKGYKEISGSYILSIKQSSHSRNIIYEVSNQYLWNLFLLQNRKCNLSKLPIAFGYSQYIKRSKGIEQTASLDRIDSTKGYIEGNLQWLHKTINLMKLDLPQSEFINLCKLISENNG